jgi:tetrapyrrole methylase family protein/MazG family protein
MSASDSFIELVQIVRTLRGPEGCPWDREQTFYSLTPYIIEEAYELVDAMTTQDPANLKEEIGDVLLHVVMLSLMGEDQGLFTFDATIRGISEKMIRRHPHVFGTVSVGSSDEVVHNWETIKLQESTASQKGLLDSIPKHLPAAMQAQKLQKKAARIGFDWPDTQGPIEKISEELAELTTAIQEGDIQSIHAEFGDLLFSIINVGRKLQIDCEEALQSTNKKFRQRFSDMEREASDQERPLHTLSLDQLNTLWDNAKKGLHQ